MEIEIFKTGSHTSSSGKHLVVGPVDLDKIVAQSTGKEVPIVVGHPKMEDPAYGWTKSVTRRGDILFADVEFDPEFQKLVEEKKYRNVSISLNPDFSLRHIGFLGAVPPAVKGLKPVQFADDVEGVMSFGEVEPEPAAEPTPDPVPDPEPAVDPEPAPADDTDPGEEDPHLRRIAELEAKLAALEAAQAAQFAASKKAEFAEFADAQVKAGKVKPDMKEKIVSVLEFFHTNDAGVLNFSDTEPVGAVAFRELITSLPAIVTPGRIPAAQFAEKADPVKICTTPSELAAVISETMENN